MLPVIVVSDWGTTLLEQGALAVISEEMIAAKDAPALNSSNCQVLFPWAIADVLCRSKPRLPFRAGNRASALVCNGNADRFLSRADDLIPEESDVVQKAIKRLPPKEAYDRVFRLRRAFQVTGLPSIWY
jgi:hypothetical protein